MPRSPIPRSLLAALAVWGLAGGAAAEEPYAAGSVLPALSLGGESPP